MNPRTRTVVFFLLALLLPLQGAAAACAQICARFGAAHQVPAMPIMVKQGQAGLHQGYGEPGHESMPADHDAPLPEHGHCGPSEMGAGKCCQAHVFVAEGPHALAPVEPASFERHDFAAHWTNFIPEEPSPPPIAAFRA